MKKTCPIGRVFLFYFISAHEDPSNVKGMISQGLNRRVLH